MEDVIDILKEYSDLQGTEEISLKKPTHGNCCTCQDCGYYHDEYVCLHNKILKELEKVIFEV